MTRTWKAAIAAGALACMACGEASSPSASADSEVVARDDQPGKTQVKEAAAVSADALAAGAGILAAVRRNIADPLEDPASVALQVFAVDTTLKEVHIAEMNGAKRYFFLGEPDDDVVPFVVDEIPSGFEAPPSYTAKQSSDPIPPSARRLPDAEIPLLRTLFALTEYSGRTSETGQQFELFAMNVGELTKATIAPNDQDGAGRSVLDGLMFRGAQRLSRDRGNLKNRNRVLGPRTGKFFPGARGWFSTY